VLNSQLWGELPLVVPRKGLQPVTLSLCGFPTRLLFPVIAFCIGDALVYSMTEFELNVQGFPGRFSRHSHSNNARQCSDKDGSLGERRRGKARRCADGE